MKPPRCPDCGAFMIFVSGPRTFWGCRFYPSCNATVSAGADGVPVARPGDRETRSARRRCHLELDITAKRLAIDKGQVYLLLSQLLGIPANQCHIGTFTKARCFEAIRRLEKATQADAESVRRKGA